MYKTKFTIKQLSLYQVVGEGRLSLFDDLLEAGAAVMTGEAGDIMTYLVGEKPGLFLPLSVIQSYRITTDPDFVFWVDQKDCEGAFEPSSSEED